MGRKRTPARDSTFARRAGRFDVACQRAKCIFAGRGADVDASNYKPEGHMGRKRPKLKKSGRRKIGRKKRKQLHKRRKRKS